LANLLKTLLLVVTAIVGLGAVAGIALYLFFDPNDFRDDISEGVLEATGRELLIEGDISLSVFPWIAIGIGHTELGNAEGFGSEPFLSFDDARVGVQLLPLLLKQEIAIDTVTLDGFLVNLSVAEDGTTNWDDLASGDGAAEPAASTTSGGTPPKLEIAGISINDANVAYNDAQSGSRYAVSALRIESGRIAPGQPFDLETEFDVTADPGEMAGHLSISGTITPGAGFQQIAIAGLNVSGDMNGILDDTMTFNFDARNIEIDAAAQRADLGEMDVSVLGISLSTDVEPFSYAGTPQPTMSMRVNEFSLKELLQTIGSEAPVTSDPNALQRISFAAKAAVGDTAIFLSEMQLKLDDTTMQGTLSLPMTADGALRFDLQADRINLDPYMAPASEADADTADAGDGNIEIPVDTIRALHAIGSIRLAEAMLSGMKFENMEMGINSAGGKLRLHPITADLFDGKYQGDVRIDASGNVPSIAVDENIIGVSLTPLAQSMFEQENISGTINGRFVLSGSGANLDAIQRDIDGNMSFELADGEWLGTDVWHQLRAARAAFRGEPQPAVREPVRTEFSAVSATGTVTDGVFSNNDLKVELPFMQLSGGGTVDFVAATVDYSLQARVLNKPELQGSATAEELSDLSRALIPLSVTGPLGSPSVRPDIQAMVRAEVERQVQEKTDELKDQVLDSLFGADEPAQEDGAENQEGEEPEDEQKSPEEEIKDALKNIFRQ
jgi:AsmA protein